jgi:hypothetical protein
MQRTILLLLSFIAVNASAVEATETIPAIFQGRWAPSISECSSHPIVGGDYPDLVTITEKNIKYYESTGSIITAAYKAPELVVILDFSFEDQVALLSKKFKITDSGIKLMSVSNTDEVLASYVKCL